MGFGGGYAPERNSRFGGVSSPPPFQREAGRDCLSGCATRISPGIKRAGATLRPWSLSLLRQSLVLELRREELAVQTGDMRNGNLLGALGLAGSRVGAVAEAQFVHLGDHRLGAASTDRKSTRLNSSHSRASRMPSSA